MILIQISSANGPVECCLAVAHAFKRLAHEAQQLHIDLQMVEQIAGPAPGTYRSIILSLHGLQAEQLCQRWCGSVQWICQSTYRPAHKRKNWFIGIHAIPLPATHQLENDILFEAMRASGPGGQHVNKTDSAIRATHVATGIQVRVQSERSQHANKKLAVMLIAHKLRELQANTQAQQKAQQRLLHYQVERGNPILVFKGMQFKPAELIE